MGFVSVRCSTQTRYAQISSAEMRIVMAEIITDKIKEALNAEGTLKSIATVDKNGVPHMVYKGSLHLDSNGNFEFYDIL
jgi:hypothetical protein